VTVTREPAPAPGPTPLPGPSQPARPAGVAAGGGPAAGTAGGPGATGATGAAAIGGALAPRGPVRGTPNLGPAGVPGAPAQQARPGYTPTGEKIGRNDPCWCGSGAKYKKCHGR
jgi:preprotein translocase subunit SecA